MVDRRVKVGVVGCGVAASAYYLPYLFDPNKAELVAVCELEAGADTYDSAAAEGVTGVPIWLDQLANNGLDKTLAPLKERGFNVCQIEVPLVLIHSHLIRLGKVYRSVCSKELFRWWRIPAARTS